MKNRLLIDTKTKKIFTEEEYENMLYDYLSTHAKDKEKFGQDWIEYNVPPTRRFFLTENDEKFTERQINKEYEHYIFSLLEKIDENIKYLN